MEFFDVEYAHVDRKALYPLGGHVASYNTTCQNSWRANDCNGKLKEVSKQRK